MRVFLSHSSADNQLARRLCGDLKKAKVDVWIDQLEIGVGEEFAPRVERGVDEAEILLVLLTRASVASEWVKREWRRKVETEAQTGRICVVPVRGEDCEIPDFLAQRSHSDIAGGSYPLGLSHLLTLLSYYTDATVVARAESATKPDAASATMVPLMTPIALEVSGDLIPIFERDSAGANRFLDELSPRLHEALHARFGFHFPGIRVRGNESEPPRSALIMIDEVPEITLEVGADDVLVEATVATLSEFGVEGADRVESFTAATRVCIGAADRAAAVRAGFTTWDAGEYICLVLEAVLQRMAALFVDIDVTRRLVDSVASIDPDLVAGTVPKAVSWFELTDILRRLVSEGISVGDITQILKALSGLERKSGVQDTVLLAEKARHALRRQITAQFSPGRDPMRVIELEPGLEDTISHALIPTPTGCYFALEPEITAEILSAVRVLKPDAGVLILVTAPEVRPYFRQLVKLEFPSLHVLSRQDLDTRSAILSVGRLGLGAGKPS